MSDFWGKAVKIGVAVIVWTVILGATLPLCLGCWIVISGTKGR